jgi:hypothetical protein
MRLLEEVVVRVPEEAQTRGEDVDVHPSGDRRLDVGDAVGNGEGDLLHRGGAGLADVIAADADGVPLRHVGAAVLEDVGDDPHARPRWIHIGAAGDVLLEDVVLDGAADRRGGHPLLLSHQLVQQQQDCGGGVDRHARAHGVERQAGQEHSHVGDRVDGHADLAHLALGAWVVAVVAHLRRQVEGTAQPGLAGRQQELEPLVRGLCRAEARVLAHRPQPAAIHGRVHAAGVRRRARRAELRRRIPSGQIVRPVQGLHLDAAVSAFRRAVGVAHQRPA